MSSGEQGADRSQAKGSRPRKPIPPPRLDTMFLDIKAEEAGGKPRSPGTRAAAAGWGRGQARHTTAVAVGAQATGQNVANTTTQSREKPTFPDLEQGSVGSVRKMAPTMDR